MSKIDRKNLSQKLISQRYVFTLSQTYFVSIYLAGLFSEPQTSGASKDQVLYSSYDTSTFIQKAGAKG